MVHNLRTPRRAAGSLQMPQGPTERCRFRCFWKWAGGWGLRDLGAAGGDVAWSGHPQEPGSPGTQKQLQLWRQHTPPPAALQRQRQDKGGAGDLPHGTLPEGPGSPRWARWVDSFLPPHSAKLLDCGLELRPRQATVSALSPCSVISAVSWTLKVGSQLFQLSLFPWLQNTALPGPQCIRRGSPAAW